MDANNGEGKKRAGGNCNCTTNQRFNGRAALGLQQHAVHKTLCTRLE